MSERAKKVLYTVFGAIALLAAVAGTALIVVFSIKKGGSLSPAEIAVYCVAFVCFLILPLNLVVHELGHVLFGVLCGMKPVCVQIGRFVFQRGKVKFSLNPAADGMSAMLARNTEHVRGKLLFSALGGAVCNFIYGAVFLIIWIMFPSPAVLFFALFAPLNLYEGFMAIVPAQRPGGATDGAVVAGLAGRKPFAEVMLAVIRVQSALLKKTYADIPKNWLFDVPVVREDDVLFLALTQLRWQYSFRVGDEETALEQLNRLEDIFGYCEDPDIACDLAYANVVLFGDISRAGEYLQSAKGAKGTLSYFVAAAALGQEECKHAEERIRKEKSVGIRDFLSFQHEKIEK